MLLDEKKIVCKYPACTTEPGIASFLFMGQNAGHATSVCVEYIPPMAFTSRYILWYTRRHLRFFSEESAVTISTVKGKWTINSQSKGNAFKAP